MKLAEALYVLNKTAKTYRDVRNDLKKLLFDKDDNISENSEEYLIKTGINPDMLISVADKNSDYDYVYYSAYDIKQEIKDEEENLRDLESEIYIDEVDYNDMDEDKKREADAEREFLQIIYDDTEERLDYLKELLYAFEANKSNAHELLQDLRDRQNNIYDLKDKALFILDLPADSYHNVNGKIMKLVHYDGFSFHTFLSEDEEILYEEGKIEASKSIEELIPAKSFDENELIEAMKTVKAFIEQNEEKLDNFESHNSSYSSSYYSSYSSRSSHPSYSSYSCSDDDEYYYDHYPEYYDNDEDDYY